MGYMNKPIIHIVFWLALFQAGKSYSQDWESDFIEASKYLQHIEPDKALIKIKSAQNILQNTLLTDDYINSILLEATCYIILGKYDQALKTAKYADSISLKLQGEISQSHFNCLGTFVLINKKIGSKTTAAKFIIKQLDIGEKLWGKGNSKNITFFLMNGDCLIETENVKYVRKKIDDILRTNVLDSAYEIEISVHDLLSKVYRSEKNFGLQLNESKYIINTCESYFESTNFDSTMTSMVPLFSYSNAVDNLVDEYMLNGEELKVINLLSEKLLKIKKIDNGSNSFQVIISNFYAKLGEAYKTIYLYKQALLNYNSALSIIEKSLGNNNVWYYTRLDDLADLYLAEGQYVANKGLIIKADSLYRQHLNWIFNGHPNDATYVSCMSNIALSMFAIKEFAKTREIYSDIYNKYINSNFASNGEKNRYIINALFGIARTFDEENNFIQAEIYHKKQLDFVQGNIKDLNIIEVIYAKHNLASFYKNFNRPKDAALYYNEILSNKYETILSANKRDELLYLFEAIENAINIGDDKYLKYFEKFANRQKALIDSNLALPVKEQLEYLKTFKTYNQKLLSLAFKNKTNSAIANIAYNNYLNVKNLTSKNYSVKNNNQKRKQVRICSDSIKNALTDHDATLDFVSFPFFNNNWTDSIINVCIINKKNYRYPLFTYLSNQKTIDSIFGSNNQETYENNINEKYSNNKLYTTFIYPIDSSLKDINTIYVSVMNSLQDINLGEIKSNENYLMGEKYNICLLPSTIDVLSYKPTYLNSSSIKIAIIYGGVDYDKASKSLFKQENKNENHLGLEVYDLVTRTAFSKFNYLPGTLGEATDIQQLNFKNSIKSIILTGSDATETSFKKLTGTKEPFILHIATHGYFFPDPQQRKEVSSVRLLESEQKNFFKWSDDPLLRSGLILAGANNTWGKPDYVSDSTEDGILTSYEISNLDLSGCQLVVLSACETGLGDNWGSEGVFGLQRAFKMAGVKNIIMSLWKVPDAQTSELMTRFYTYCFAGKSVHDALQAAQTDMRKKYPPYYWAGFKLLE